MNRKQQSNGHSHSAANPEDLINQARRGDQQATADLLETYRNYLSVLAQIQLGKTLQRKLDPADLVQETYLAACRDFHQFRGRSEQELVGWLRTIMANTGGKMIRQYTGTRCRDVQREQNLSAALDHSAEALSRLVSPLSTPSKGAIRREAAVVLADKLAELPDHYRQAIVLYHIEGLTIAEVAERLERSPEATNSLLARALIKLRSLMKDAA